MTQGRLHPLFLLAIFSVAQGFVLVAEARASGSHQAQAISHRVPHRAAAGPRTHSGRSLASPGFGSAANVRPGFYRQLDTRHRGSHHGGAVPVYIYPIYAEPLYAEPYYSGPPSAPAPAPAPAPVYVIQPPATRPAPAAPPVSPAPAPAPPPEPRSTEPGEVRFSVQPADARVYLDDDFLGTGAELAALEAGQLYPPGVHVLEVTHPDHRPQRLVFGVSHTEPKHVLIDLSTDRVGRRSRVK